MNEQSPDRTEGDINLSECRRKWQDRTLNEQTRDLLFRDEQVFLRQSLSTPCLTVLEACNGSYLQDLQGKQYLDFHGNSAHQVGYGHPKVLEAVEEEMHRLSFCPRRFTNLPAIELAEKLVDLAPGDLSKLLLCPAGTVANGIALKLARLCTGRFKTISFWDAFHGASLDAISIGGEALFRNNMGPLLPGCIQIPAPGSHAMGEEPLGWEEVLSYTEFVMKREGDVAAFIAEPLRCTTVEIPPVPFWKGMRELCDRHDALLIFDEIPICLGRTGYWFTCEHYDVVPDILCIGKGLGGGVLPLAATLVRDGLDQGAAQAIGHYTHEKSTLGCAAALAALHVIEDQQLVERSRIKGKEILSRLQEFAESQNGVVEARGLGLMIGVEMATADVAERVLYSCLEHGLSFKISGGTTLTLTPPLTISDEEIEKAISILCTSIIKTLESDYAS